MLDVPDDKRHWSPLIRPNLWCHHSKRHRPDVAVMNNEASWKDHKASRPASRPAGGSTDGHEYIFTLHLNECYSPHLFYYSAPHDKSNSSKWSNCMLMTEAQKTWRPESVSWFHFSLTHQFIHRFKVYLKVGFNVFGCYIRSSAGCFPPVPVCPHEILISLHYRCFQKPSILFSQMKSSMEKHLIF